MQHPLSGKRILVTGGTGFIGGRVVEKLFQECNATVRVLVRNYARALRVARYPIDLVYGDINQLDQVSRAAEGCDIVIHCAYGNSGDVQERHSANVLGTKNVLEAALRARAKRVVHLSTIQVYGPLPDGDLDETVPRRYWGESYSDAKLDAENVVLDYHRQYGLQVVILQPTIVYGPHSLIWTENLLNSLRKERHILVDHGAGLCNAVYVDDVADAAILSSFREQAIGESFLISAEKPAAWRDFYGSYERMLGISATIGMAAADAKAYDVKNRSGGPSLFKELFNLMCEEPVFRERILGSREGTLIRSIASAVLSQQLRDSIKHRLKGENGADHLQNGHPQERPIRLLKFPLDVKYYKTKAVVRIDKARHLLGYQPAFDLASGMRLTEQWARWSNLLPEVSSEAQSAQR